MADGDLQTEAYQYPNAHIGHLTEYQQTQLNEFKRLVQQESTFVPPGSEDPALACHDDESLLRYLRARKFNPAQALEQFRDTEKWRRENELEKLYNNIDLNDYELTRRLYPQWTGRRDKRGIPVYVYEIAHLNQKTMTAYDNAVSSSTPSSSNASLKMLRLFALYENLTRFVMPLCTAVPDRPYMETPISQSNNIVDISGVGLKQFWNLKQHMQDASTLATAHYPETLDRIFIIGAPSFFPTVWGWIKKWFDPITVSKIFILSASTLTSTLEEYIDSENIPKKYGGRLDYEYGMLPVLEPAIDNVLQWENPEIQHGQKTMPSGPIKWEKAPDGGLSAVAVGCEQGVPRNKTVARLPSRSPEPEQRKLRPAPPSLYRTTTGVSTHPLVSDDADSYLEDHPPFEDDASTDMQGSTLSPHRSEYTVIDSSSRTIGVAPMSVPVTSVSPPPPQAAMSASEISAMSTNSGVSASTATPPSIAVSHTTSDLSASSSSIAESYISKDRRAYTDENDDTSSTTSRSKNNMGSSVYKAALDKATKAMESVGLIGDRKSSPVSINSASAASISSPPMSPPPQSQTALHAPAPATNNTTYLAYSGNAATTVEIVADPAAGTEASAGIGSGASRSTEPSSIAKKDIEEVLRNKYASGKR